MPKCLLYVCLLLVITLAGCNGNSKNSSGYGDPVTTPGDILASPENFAQYYYGLKLWQDFIPLDTTGKRITKASFLQQASLGGILPIRLSKVNTACYQLYTCTEHSDEVAGISALAAKEYHNYQMEGKPLPGFNYTDLNGNVYNQQTTKGKIVVWKCWFIHCVSCVAEMPELNKLVDSYKTRSDIAFISVAFDSAQLLKNFLVKRPFSYAVAPVSENYLVNDLGLREFPTHIIINKQGLVVKIVNDYKDMEEVLKKEAGE